MKSRKLWLVLVIICALLAVATGAMTGFLLLKPSHANTASTVESEVDNTEVEEVLNKTEAPEIDDDNEMDEGITKRAASEQIIAALALETYAVHPRRNISEFINLQGVVDQWLAQSVYQEAAVEIFDVDYWMVAASSNASVSMHPRSLYKLFYVYDAYTQIDAELDDINQIYYNGQSLGYCLDIIIRQSDNACAEAMLNDAARLKRVEKLISGLGMTNTISTGLMTSAHDVSLLLQRYYTHPELSATSWQKIRSSALNQAWTYRKGLPSGFSTAMVYDKAGWSFGGGGFDVYNDAALVEFPMEDGRVRKYIMVVMTSYPSSYAILTQLGTMLENAILYGM